MTNITVKFLSDEAIETIKGNLDYFTDLARNNPADSSSILKKLPENHFIEKDYSIPKFELKMDENGNYSNVDFENAVILYNGLKDLPERVIGDERFWAWVILELFYPVAIQAMPIDSGKNVIADHWLFMQGQRRGLMFGVFSRAFFRVKLTVDSKNENDKYHLTRFASENIRRYREFTWRSYSNNAKIVRGALRAEKKLIQDFTIKIESIKDYYPEIAKFISKLGSVKLLDILTEEYIFNSVYDFGKQMYERQFKFPITNNQD